MLGDHPILSDPTMVISALGLLVVFERQLIAAIRAGRVLMAELGLLKKNPTTRKFVLVKFRSFRAQGSGVNIPGPHWSHSASGLLSPDHPCWEDQVATRWPLIRMPR
jgi:hypothetical protein